MNPKIYDRVTTACLAAAVASALLFEHSGKLRLLVGVLGIVAGLVAMLVYFRNNYSETFSPAGRGQAEESNAVCLVGEEQQHTTHSVSVDVHSMAFEVFREGLLRDWMVLDKSCVFAERRNEPDMVGRVVEIVERLSAPESMRAFEFILSPDGNFTIRPMVHRHHTLSAQQLQPDLEAAEDELSEGASFKVH
jgi:hypothetical protein